ncbi:MAG: hypothetical protein ACFE9S_15575 [Candidatus Hermodarchaeota archaeon]
MTELEKIANNIKNFYNVDVNIFEIIQKAYDEHFNRRKNKLGCSEIAFGARKIIISRLFNIPIENNMKMLHGKIHHRVLQTPKILKKIIENIADQLNTHEPVEVIVEKELSYELLPGKLLEGHIDIYTSAFLIEIKTTSIPLKYWAKDIAPYHYVQLNTYLGLEKQEFGFIIYINLRAFDSKIVDFDEVWNEYGCFIPVVFDKEIFDLTLQKAKIIFELMEEERWDIDCPEYEWECKTCPKEVQAICKGENNNNQVFIFES